MNEQKKGTAKVLDFVFSRDPKVKAIKELKGTRFSTILRGKAITGRVEKVFVDSQNQRVILELDTKCQDGIPLCVDLYPWGVPSKAGCPPYGSHVPVKPKFTKS